MRFRFFHRVDELELSATKNVIEKVHLIRQVDLEGDAYDPLVWVKRLPCWPSDPRWDQVKDGAAIRDALAAKGLTLESAWCHQQTGTETLTRGEDFDLVVCGISVAALPDIASGLIEESDAWRRMLASTKTVQTQALQLWFDRDTEALGWTGGRTILTGYVEPFDTWGDLSHLLPEESWPEPGGPKSLGYFCNAFPDAAPIPPRTDEDFPRRERERVFEDARRYVETHAGRLWPKATVPGQPTSLDYARLYDPNGGTGVERLRAQYWRANIDPTERYVLSVPGSLQYRLWAGRSGFLNLTLAGDWVTTSLNAGCAEAAVEGGLRAAHAILGFSPRPFVHRHVEDDLTLAEGD